ncbi:MAG: transketolase [Gemmatimonadetes bacterium]|nr:transketolase [Gemmatimonadota bacterium]
MATQTTLDLLCINTIRTLAMDAVQQAESGHPGTPMALAPLGYRLYTRHLRHDPADPHWPDRDRFVLSAGHASMLQYALLHLTGYGVSLDDLKAFRQWGSLTPGHPEVHHTPGVETTTGPLGQGLATAVGMAMAEAQLGATFNRDGHAILRHWTYVIAGDGDLMEGVSHEAASFAGHFGLGRLIVFFDDNRITIDGSVDLTCSDDQGARFAALGWQVLRLDDVNDLAAIDRVIAEAKADESRPTLVVTRTHIGYGSPNKQDTAKAHGEPLGKDEIVLTKQAYGWPSTEPFFVPAEALAHMREARARGTALHDQWSAAFGAYKAAFPAEAAELERRWAGTLPAGWEAKLPSFTPETGAIASRNASGIVVNAVAGVLPELFGGSADLAGSNLTMLKDVPKFSLMNPAGRNLHYGIREFGMGAIMNGVALHGGYIPYGGTFLVFADYMRPAIRLAALMGTHVIYVFTHDSIGLGEDGPTHQPVEHLASLRVIPNLLVLRPADANEVSEAWRTAITHTSGPVALVLTRQKLPCFDRAAGFAPVTGARRGAYVLKEAQGGAAQVVLMATGSEVSLAVEAQALLARDGIRARVVSAPSLELFAAEDAGYRATVLPAGVPRVAIEAAHPASWHRWVGDHGTIIGLDRFGASAPYQVLYKEFGITASAAAAAAAALVAR